MAQSRPSKRARVGEVFHDIVPLPEDYSIVHARDGRLKRVGNSVRTAPTNRTAHHESNNTWSTTESWTPFDDPEFALDPNGDSYNEVLNQEVMEEPTKGLPAPKQRTRSAVSVRYFNFNDLFHAYISCIILEKATRSLEGTPPSNLSRRNGPLGWKG
jgi:hypothetical protein